MTLHATTIRGRFLSAVALTCALLTVATSSGAQVVHPNAIVSLNASVAVGDIVSLWRTGGTTDPFVVPPGNALVLTDIVLSPQALATTEIKWQVFNSGAITTNVNGTSTPDDSSSYQLHLTTGMVFKAGTEVRFALTFADAPLNVSAMGYLVRLDR